MNALVPTPQVNPRVRESLVNSRFLKIGGPAGDWIVFHEPTPVVELTPEHVQWLCDRSLGIGASGVVVTTPLPETTHQSAFHLTAWLADGKPAENLTEAARVATYALAALDKIQYAETTHHVFNSSFGLTTTVYTPSYVGVDIGQWSYTAPETASVAGSDSLVMAAGLTDPRPGLSIRTTTPHLTIAVESLEELEGIDLSQRPSIEPPVSEPTSINFVVPQEPLVVEGMGQLAMRHYAAEYATEDLASAAAAATVAFQVWAGLPHLSIWNVSTPHGNIVVQLHDDQRVSTFLTLFTVFFGRL